VHWLAPSASELNASDWEDGERRVLCMVSGSDADDRRMLFTVLNASPDPVSVTFPGLGSRAWVPILDTGLPTGRPDGREPSFAAGGTFVSEPRSVILFRGI
jgi:pullulanase/glycogen debranching enzyme